jgi:hypothetical protein
MESPPAAAGSLPSLADRLVRRHWWRRWLLLAAFRSEALDLGELGQALEEAPAGLLGHQFADAGH